MFIVYQMSDLVKSWVIVTETREEAIQHAKDVVANNYDETLVVVEEVVFAQQGSKTIED